MPWRNWKTRLTWNQVGVPCQGVNTRASPNLVGTTQRWGVVKLAATANCQFAGHTLMTQGVHLEVRILSPQHHNSIPIL